VFPAFVRLRYSHPDIERPFRVPGGAATAWVVSFVSAGFAGDRMAFEAMVLTPVAILVVVCGIFLVLGARARRASVEPVHA
jgi:uncharacterized membrane protein YphA (DoxX/SURF4 family)